jgi:SAM-dependent methyltransferase
MRTPEAPDGTQKFDEYVQSYSDLHAKSLAASGENPEYFAQYKLDCLKRCGAPKSEPLLDYGCGIGNVTTKLATHFEAIHGYDPSSQSLDAARQRMPKATFHSDPKTLPQDFFATGILSGVLHHVPRAERLGLLETILSKLAPGGRLFVFEHNPLNPLTRRLVANCEFDDDADLLWPWTVRELLQRAGFKPVQLDYIVFFPKALALLRPLEPRLRWLAAGAQTMTIGTRGA